MKHFIAFCILSLLIMSCYRPSANDSMRDLKVLEGEWVSYKGIVFNENWSLLDDNQMLGEGFSMNGNDTSFFENLKISKQNDSIYYSVLFKKNPQVDFVLTDAGKNDWIFTNAENDYPSIIKYELKNDTLLLVTTANIRGNKEQFFYLKRK